MQGGPSEYLTASEVAELLRLDKTFVYQQANAGVIPGRKIGTVWRFSRKAIERWMGDDLPSSSPAGEGAR